jgi:hypothetical protein
MPKQVLSWMLKNLQKNILRRLPTNYTSCIVRMITLIRQLYKRRYLAISIATIDGVVRVCVVSMLLVTLLFANAKLEMTSGLFRSVLGDIVTTLRDPGIQLIVFISLAINFAGILLLRRNVNLLLTRITESAWWLASTMFSNVVVYCLFFSPATPAVTLLAGAVLGQGMMVWAHFADKNQKARVGNNFTLLP